MGTRNTGGTSDAHTATSRLGRDLGGGHRFLHYIRCWNLRLLLVLLLLDLLFVLCYLDIILIALEEVTS
jgi:hypothetical protein